MKKLKLFAAIIVLAAVFTSCAKKDTSPSGSNTANNNNTSNNNNNNSNNNNNTNNTNNNNNSGYYMSATVGGTSWNASYEQGIDSLGYIYITGTGTSGSMTLAFSSTLTTGTYSLSVLGSFIEAGYIQGATVEDLGTTGSLTITSISATAVAGTFSFSGVNAINSSSFTVTNSTFKVKL